MRVLGRNNIGANILFFEKGQPTETVWFFEHPYPPGYKSYSRSKPLTIQEFDREKAWWQNREVNEYAWTRIDCFAWSMASVIALVQPPLGEK